MKLKTWSLLIFTFVILGISIFIPIILSDQQDAKLFKTVHSEKLETPSNVKLPVAGIKEKLTLIASADQTDSGTIMLKTSGHANPSSVEQAVTLARKSITELAGKDLIPETDLNEFSINEFSHMVYSDSVSKTTASCYSFWANGDAYDLYLMMDADSGMIYTLNFIPHLNETESSRFHLSERTVKIWSEYLDLSLLPVNDLSLYNYQLYQVEQSSIFYLFAQDENLSNISIQLTNAQTFGYSIPDDTILTEKGRSYDAIPE